MYICRLFIFVVLSCFGCAFCLVSGIATKAAMASPKSFIILYYAQKKEFEESIGKWFVGALNKQGNRLKIALK